MMFISYQTYLCVLSMTDGEETQAALSAIEQQQNLLKIKKQDPQQLIVCSLFTYLFLNEIFSLCGMWQ